MEKVLSISIAAYNSEKFISQALDSCLHHEIVDEIEIFVIDDGGTDSTLEIARQYEEKFPNTVIPVHKKNGGYGSTVNYAIEHSKGKYFRLLDGDDWLEKDNLPKYISYLKSCDDDLVLTRMCHEYLVSGKSVVSQDDWLHCVGKRTTLDEFLPRTYAGMWEITYKTAILKDHPINLPEHTLYTDHIYIMKPIPYIKTVSCLDTIIYHYRLESEGQSVSPESRIKHSEEIIMVSEILNKYFEEKCQSSKNRQYAIERARRCYMEAFRTQLLKPKSKPTFQRIKEMDLKLKSISPDLFKEVLIDSRRLRFYRMTKYLGYYLK